MQQHALPEGRQRKPSFALFVQKLRLQTDRRQQLHLRQPDHAGGGRNHQHRAGRDR